MTGCRSSSAPASSPTQSATANEATFAAPASTFDADRAYGFLKSQCDLGARVPNSDAHTKCGDYIKTQLAPFVDKMDTQVFYFQDNARHKKLLLTNIIGVINPQAKKKIMIFTHWDTRPTADQELDAANKAKPISGADDGASGTAVLLELARVFHEKKPDAGVVLLFVDGEDWGPGEDKMYIGARHFAKFPGAYKPNYAILLDMIGDKDLNVYREVTSQSLHPELNDKVWHAAAALGHAQQFPDSVKYQISDDHDSFNNAGIPAIDLIDFDYAYWHTLHDKPDKCSPDSLKVVGDVVSKVIYDER